MKICVLCNGPGELWGWARPVIRELKTCGHDVTLWLLPCPYSSGQELRVAQSFECDIIEKKNIFHRKKFDAAIQLGGDIFWGRRLKCPLFCYTYGKKNGLEKCSSIFTAYENMAAGIKNSIVIGDLVKDALALDTGASPWRSDYEGRKIIFLPGSRREIRKKSIFLIKDIISELKNFSAFKNFEPAVLFPPFADDAEFAEWDRAELNPTRTGAGVALREAEYVVTQPGTNTLEIMHAQTNGLVIAPLSFLKEIPISGLGGLVANTPVIGAKIKEFVLRRKLKKINGYLSLPNRIANAPLLDEMAWDISTKDIAEKIVSALEDKEKLELVKRKFAEISEHSGGAAKKLCEGVIYDEDEHTVWKRTFTA